MIVRIAVVLPAPFGPEQDGDLPSGTRRPSPSRARLSPKVFTTPSSTTAWSGRWHRGDGSGDVVRDRAHRYVSTPADQRLRWRGPRRAPGQRVRSNACTSSASTPGCRAAATASCTSTPLVCRRWRSACCAPTRRSPRPQRLAELQVDLRALLQEHQPGGRGRRAGAVPGERAHGDPGRPGGGHRHGRGGRGGLRGRRVLPEPGEAGRRRRGRRLQGPDGAHGADPPRHLPAPAAGRRRRRRGPGAVPSRPRAVPRAAWPRRWPGDRRHCAASCSTAATPRSPSRSAASATASS